MLLSCTMYGGAALYQVPALLAALCPNAHILVGFDDDQQPCFFLDKVFNAQLAGADAVRWDEHDLGCGSVMEE